MTDPTPKDIIGQIKTLLGRVGVQHGRDGWYTLRVDGRSVARFASSGEAAAFSEMRCEHALLVTELEQMLAESRESVQCAMPKPGDELLCDGCAPELDES